MIRLDLNLLIASVLACASATCQAVEDAGMKIQEGYDLCAGEGDECYRHLEQTAVADSIGKANRNGDTLVIETKTKKIYLRTSDAGKEPRSYIYLGFYRESGFHLINRVSYGEDVDYLFISDRSGKTIIVPGIPHVSPSGTYIVAMADINPYPYEIIIWKVTANDLLQDFRHESNEYAEFTFKSWEGNSIIKLETSTTTHGKRCPTKILLSAPQRLSRLQNKWVLADDSTATVLRCE